MHCFLLPSESLDVVHLHAIHTVRRVYIVYAACMSFLSSLVSYLLDLKGWIFKSQWCAVI